MERNLIRVVLATVPDRRIRSGSVSEMNRHQRRGPGRQYTHTDKSGMVQRTSPNQSELGGWSAGCPAGLSGDLYDALAFAV